jgi:hypothetical protein
MANCKEGPDAGLVDGDCKGGIVMNIDNFKKLLQKEKDPANIVKMCYFNKNSEHISTMDLDYIQKRFCERFSLKKETIRLIPVGSAHLGFSLVDKTAQDPKKIRYRKFMPDSDYDIAIISDKLFDIIWFELSNVSLRHIYFPLRVERFGDYLAAGWIRPDKIPHHIRLFWLDNWWSLINSLTKTIGKNAHKIRSGLFRNEDVLIKYLQRSIKDCQRMEGIV